MADQVLPDATPKVDNVGTHDHVVHEIVAVLISSYCPWIDVDEGRLLASDVNIVAWKETFRDIAFGVDAEANGSIVDMRFCCSVTISDGAGEEPLCVEDGHAVPAAVDADRVTSSKAGHVLLELKVRPQWFGPVSFEVAHNPSVVEAEWDVV